MGPKSKSAKVLFKLAHEAVWCCVHILSLLAFHHFEEAFALAKSLFTALKNYYW